MKSMPRNFFLCLLFFAFFSGTIAKQWKILFVGNSLTYANDVPSIINELARQEGREMTSSSFLFPDYSLEDHWNEGKVKAELEKGDYDFVVAQQGPSALPESRVLLIDYSNRFAEASKTNKAKFALYMVWPSRARSFDMDKVITSYSQAAEKTGSILCPAGKAWKLAWQSEPTLPLYSPDNFHPSMMGSVLAAFTIYATLANKKDLDFIRYELSTWKDEISEAQFGVLKAAAVRSIGNGQ
ncbi:MAG: SGNH/GDSL hydrolase family protein [Chitinophagaceae bacterium]|nr:SGNH/GDSL hydrolase family protein [Chitinophagaceae bacterium]